VLAENLVIYLG